LRQSRAVIERDADLLSCSAPYIAIAEMDYPKQKTFEAAIQSPENQAVAAERLVTLTAGHHRLRASTG
jgi:hypothetical protein